MRATQFFISTLKEAPQEAELISHQLMLRAGYIRRLGSGLYTWMPLGLRVLRKIEAIVREEMNKAEALELLMPSVIPAELWQETGRWEKFGPQMLKIKDRHDRDFCYGPTHEEVISDVARREIKSYRQLPINFYQIQTKFRDEIRPRFGVMRAREFIMKDAYSFHADLTSLEDTYAVMKDTYQRIFTRLGLNFRAVAADTGAIGGSGSHEFHVLADSGEDALAYSDQSDYAANVELAEAVMPSGQRPAANSTMEQVNTPSVTSCEEVATFLNLSIQQIVKSLLIIDQENKPYLILLRGDHELNWVKTEKIIVGARLASAEEVTQLGLYSGFIGPVNLPSSVTILADRSVSLMANFVCGANHIDSHYINVNFGRDCSEPKEYLDLRNVVEGDPSPDGQGSLKLCRGIEVGHIFQLRTKYAEAMNLTFLDEQGKSKVMEMGCYGIGVSRIVAAAIEQHHDKNGITLPLAIAPFSVSLISIGLKKSPLVEETSSQIYDLLTHQGIDVLWDDRDERLGVMLADQELMGIPFRIVVGDKGLQEGTVEVKGRHDSESKKVSFTDLAHTLRQWIMPNALT
jgi:prolyl-tRNA synthetase